MAATAAIRGRFAARTQKSWDSFEDRDGNRVSAGESLTLFVVTDGDEVLETVKVDREHVERALGETKDLKFGDRVEFDVVSNKWGFKYIARVVAAPVKAVS